MRPAGFRTLAGVLTLSTAPLALLYANPALAAAAQSNIIETFAPYGIGLGAAMFGLAGFVFALKWRREAEISKREAAIQLRGMRAELDDFETLLAGMPEVSIIWKDNQSEPQILGPVSTILPGEGKSEALLDLKKWLTADMAHMLADNITDLRLDGRYFDITLTNTTGEFIKANGRLIGGSAVVRLKPAQSRIEGNLSAADVIRLPDLAETQAILANLTVPAWLRDKDGIIVYANAAYLHLASSLGLVSDRGYAPEVFESSVLAGHINALNKSNETISITEKHRSAGDMKIVMFPISGGSVGYIEPVESIANQLRMDAAASTVENLTTLINAISTPVAVFDRTQHLIQYNSAFAQFWILDTNWLDTQPNERAILDKLRTDDKLPAEVDYRAWRDNHLTSYSLDATRKIQWFLPNGKTLNVVAAPASATGGVIYVYEDETNRLQMETRHNALMHVQRETLNALSEAVAVFGTDGKLRLHNPQFEELWQLDSSTLALSPHINRVAKSVADAMPADGLSIWADLKQAVVDLDPSRRDRHGRITRADNKVLEFSIVRLPDGQTLMTFIDVSERENFQRVLKERNDALVAADRLKDTFVQNVSYELRSPLTNIIGFADLLASEAVGPLNERQKEYTDYIKSSSSGLGGLIDNILDLATVDAGIVQLNPDVVDIDDLVQSAIAGVSTSSKNTGDVLNFVVHKDDDLPLFVADATRMKQVLYNLTSNAARYCEPDSEIKLTIENRNQHIAFIVEDEGVGIPAEMRNAMFQRFEGHDVGGKQRGAGLGLSIVKTFVNLHGGTVRIEGRQPRGTKVTVIVPANSGAAIEDSSAYGNT